MPSLINELSRSVSIHRSITYPILICIALYLIIGLTGAASFQISSSSDILATLSASHKNKVLTTIANVLFPIAVLVTSVPVFAIVIRYNLVRGNFCSNRKSAVFGLFDSEADINQGYAIVWASLMPWIFIIPFQTKVWWLSALAASLARLVNEIFPVDLGLVDLGDELDVVDLWFQHQFHHTTVALYFI